jgi:SWIM zinc finger
MATSTQSRKPVKPARTVQLLRRPDPIGLLAITVGKGRTGYMLERIPADFGATFALTKLVLVEIEPGVHEQRNADTYHVHFDRTLGDFCTCLGFLHHGMCKDGKGCRHIAALAELRGQGLL